MEESVEGSILPVIMIAIFLLIIIGIVVWVVLSRRVVGPPVTPIPLAPVTPSNANSGNVASPPASVPIVRVSSSRCKDKKCDSSSTSSEESSRGHSSKHSTESSSEHYRSDSEADTLSSHSGSYNGSCIRVYERNMSWKEDIDVPERNIISIAHSGRDLYAATHSGIYIRNEGDWNYLGSVEEPITELLDHSGELIVRTEYSDYVLTESGGKTKMSRCKTKQKTYRGENVRLVDGTLIEGRLTLARDVDCFHISRGETLLYAMKNRLYRTGDGTKNKQYRSELVCNKTECEVRALCACDKYIYALVGDGGRVSGSGNTTETEER